MATIRDPFSIQFFRCSNGDDGGGWGGEDEAAGRVREGLASEACRVYPIVNDKFG